MFRPYRIERREAEPMEEIMKLFLRKRGLGTRMNAQLISDAWARVSGASAYPIGRFYRDGVLTVTLSSSVARNQLYYRREELVKALNRELEKESLFDREKGLVKSIVLR